MSPPSCVCISSLSFYVLCLLLLESVRLGVHDAAAEAEGGAELDRVAGLGPHGALRRGRGEENKRLDPPPTIGGRFPQALACMYADCSLFSGSSLRLTRHQCGYRSKEWARTSGEVSLRSPPDQARRPPTEWKMSSNVDTDTGSGLLSGLKEKKKRR